MPHSSSKRALTRRRFLSRVLANAPPLALALPTAVAAQPVRPVPTMTINTGDLKVVFDTGDVFDTGGVAGTVAPPGRAGRCGRG
jgi:hypothetical protein